MNKAFFEKIEPSVERKISPDFNRLYHSDSVLCWLFIEECTHLTIFFIEYYISLRKVNILIEWIKDPENFRQAQEKNKKFLILVFYANFSSHAKRALAEIKQFGKENKQAPVCIIDVERVKGIHKKFGVENVPTVLGVREGKVIQRIEGVESAKFYAHVFSGINPPTYKKGKKTVSHRVIVYSGPGCPACGTAKAYLRRRGISFREVDIGRDHLAAEKLVRRSGQMAVPQIDIDGHLVVGFNQAQIEKLLQS
jgi:glutaredoxin 3